MFLGWISAGVSLALGWNVPRKPRPAGGELHTGRNVSLGIYVKRLQIHYLNIEACRWPLGRII
jgi:hypothetical protein